MWLRAFLTSVSKLLSPHCLPSLHFLPHRGGFEDEEDCARARDQVVREKNLTHRYPLNFPSSSAAALAVRVARVAGESSKPLKRMSTPGDNEKFRGMHRPSGFHNVYWNKANAKWQYAMRIPGQDKRVQK